MARLPVAVTIARDGALHTLRCAEPCGPDGRCINTGGHPGMSPLPEAQQGVCYLGAGATAEEARARAAALGWRVVE